MYLALAFSFNGSLALSLLPLRNILYILKSQNHALFAPQSPQSLVAEGVYLRIFLHCCLLGLRCLIGIEGSESRGSGHYGAAFGVADPVLNA